MLKEVKDGTWYRRDDGSSIGTRLKEDGLRHTRADLKHAEANLAAEQERLVAATDDVSRQFAEANIRRLTAVADIHRKRLAETEAELEAERADEASRPIVLAGGWGRRYLSDAEFEPMEAAQHQMPVMISDSESRYWWYQDKFYKTDNDLTAEDVAALVNEKANRKRLKLEKAHALQAMTTQLDDKAKRQPIPRNVKLLVWQRDGGKCVECGSNEELEYDHIIPLAMGGSNTDRNLQLLCAVCNRRKGATLG